MKTDKVVTHITHWLKEYAHQAGAKGFIIGISGGIDSAVTSTLCALTGLKTVCVSMPIHQKTDQLQRANEHIEWLKKKFNNISSLETDLTRSFEIYKSSLPATTTAHLLSMANTRARLRMVTLYALGQSEGLLVAGTGNKIEDFGVGFFTKYGDGGVDISPIADLTKTQIYELAKHLEIIDSIQKANPTDGLFDIERTDEAQLGATYPELEWAMRFVNEELKMKSEKLVLSEMKQDGLSQRQKEVLAIYIKFHNQNKHKMVAVPVCDIPRELL
ncbi:MAG: NAD(+) synthase [Flavobacteriales bacterium]